MPPGKFLKLFEPPFLCSWGASWVLKERFPWVFSATLNTVSGSHSVVPGRAGGETRPSCVSTAPAEVIAVLPLGPRTIEVMQGPSPSTRELNSVDNMSPDFGLWAIEGRE